MYRGERYAQGYVSKFCLCAFAHAFGMGAPHPPLARSPFPSQHLTFGQVRKALLRIKILCQHNMGRSNFCRHNKGRVRLNSDHQNSISRQCPPQARPSEFVFHGNRSPQGRNRILTIRIRISRQRSPQGVTVGERCLRRIVCAEKRGRPRKA